MSLPHVIPVPLVGGDDSTKWGSDWWRNAQMIVKPVARTRFGEEYETLQRGGGTQRALVNNAQLPTTGGSTAPN